MTDEKTKTILRSIQSISSLADLILIEYQNVLADTRFSLPVLNQKAKRIKEYSIDIQKQLNVLAKIKDKEEALDHSLQMSRLIGLFATMDIRQLENFLDAVEKLPTEEIIDSIKILD